jgi:hypothetical protein
VNGQVARVIGVSVPFTIASVISRSPSSRRGDTSLPSFTSGISPRAGRFESSSRCSKRRAWVGGGSVPACLSNHRDCDGACDSWDWPPSSSRRGGWRTHPCLGERNFGAFGFVGLCFPRARWNEVGRQSSIAILSPIARSVNGAFTPIRGMTSGFRLGSFGCGLESGKGEHYQGMGHGARYGRTMFGKQVSRPVDGLDPPSWPPGRSRRTRRKTWSRARSDVCALQASSK